MRISLPVLLLAVLWTVYEKPWSYDAGGSKRWHAANATTHTRPVMYERNPSLTLHENALYAGSANGRVYRIDVR